MARGTTHAQKSNRRRTNAPTFDAIPLTRDGLVRGPSLEELTERENWLPGTIKWYETWRRSAQAQVFEDTDWMRLGQLAPLVEANIKRPSAAAMSEIRMNEERLGATVVDRMRARMTIDSGEPSEDAAPVVRLVDARRDIASRLQSGS